MAALSVAIVLLIVIALFASMILRFVRRRFRRMRGGVQLVEGSAPNRTWS
jgi:hypothetical protein